MYRLDRRDHIDVRFAVAVLAERIVVERKKDLNRRILYLHEDSLDV